MPTKAKVRFDFFVPFAIVIALSVCSVRIADPATFSSAETTIASP